MTYGRSPMLVKFRGRGLTVPEIAMLTGLAEATVYRRIRLGRPIEGPHRCGPEPKRFAFRGEMLTAAEIAERTGYSVSHVRRRISGNTYLEGEEARANFADDFHPNCVLLTHRGKTDSLSGWARRTGDPAICHQRKAGAEGLDRSPHPDRAEQRQAQDHQEGHQAHGARVQDRSQPHCYHADDRRVRAASRNRAAAFRERGTFLAERAPDLRSLTTWPGWRVLRLRKSTT